MHTCHVSGISQAKSQEKPFETSFVKVDFNLQQNLVNNNNGLKDFLENWQNSILLLIQHMEKGFSGTFWLFTSH